MNTTKIVFIGAGSMSFGLAMFKDIFSSRELSGSTLNVVNSAVAAEKILDELWEVNKPYIKKRI